MPDRLNLLDLLKDTPDSKSSSRSRRDFLRSLSVSGVALAAGMSSSRWLYADESEVLPAGKRLIVRTPQPLNAEPAPENLVTNYITPLESFYIRSHGAIPKVDAGSFRLSIEGLVDKALQFSVAELVERFPAQRTTATLTCAGNRRNEFVGPKIAGVAWAGGAIGNAHWGGVSLTDLLRHVGVRAGAKHVWFEGADEIVDKTETYPFGGSIPIEKAMPDTDRSPGVLVATKINDKPLPPEHGFPLRTVVPGYIGARSVKWLKKIVVSDRPSPNHYLAQAYKVIAEETPAALTAAAPIYEYALNSMIGIPPATMAVSPGKLEVRGFALPNGAAGRSLKLIELSADGGKTWTTAKTVSPVKEFCWVLWSAEINVAAQTERLIVRATDSAGETQPREMPWNAKGYQYNAWHDLRLKRE